MLMQSLPEVSAPMQECRCRSGVPAAIRAAGPHRALVRTHKFAVPGLRRQRGFTLLEALVAVVIVLAVVLLLKLPRDEPVFMRHPRDRTDVA